MGLRRLLEQVVQAGSNPRDAATVIARALVRADERDLASVLGAAPRDVARWLREPVATTPRMRRKLEEAAGLLKREKSPQSAPLARKTRIPYVAARALRPRVVLETGVADGVSSFLILNALLENEREDGRGGVLVSIDIGDQSVVCEGREIGWVVPPNFRLKWNLILGDSRVMLPNVAHSLGQIDMFFHDSLHTYDHVQFELNAVWPYVRDGGVIVVDDALWSRAFADFTQYKNMGRWKIVRGVGVGRKGSFADFSD